jgi:hypothetical protein
MVLELISWKHSFDRINEEYEIVQRKKQALDNLLSTGKISQSTYDYFSEEMNNAVAEIEKQQKALLEKMSLKVNELEQQVKILEMLLANFEIQHATGEIDDEIYQHKTELLSMGLEAAKQELDVTKESVNQFSGSVQVTEAIEPPPTPETTEPQEVETQSAEEVTAIQPEVEVEEETVPTVEPEEHTLESEEGEGEGEITEEATEETEEESLPEYSVASVETDESQSFQNPPENPEETPQNPEESQSTETDTEEQTQEEYQTENEEQTQEEYQTENEEQTQEEYQTE